MAALRIEWSTRHCTNVDLEAAAVAEWAAGAAIIRSPQGWAGAEEIQVMMGRNAHFRAFLGGLYARELGLIPAGSLPGVLAPDVEGK